LLANFSGALNSEIIGGDISVGKLLLDACLVKWLREGMRVAAGARAGRKSCAWQPRSMALRRGGVCVFESALTYD
jgi:hypothetical protein